MRDLLRLIAFQLGSEVSYEELGKQLGMSKTTVEKYLDLLERSSLSIVWGLIRVTYARRLQKLASGTSTTTAFAMPLSGLSHRWPFGRMSVRCGRTTSSESGAKRTSMRDCTGSSISGAPTTNRKSTWLRRVPTVLPPWSSSGEIKCRPHRKPSKKPIPMPSFMW